MSNLVIPLSAPQAAEIACVGPKAGNLATVGHAGLPIPDGFCLTADAYRAQITALGLEATARGVFGADDGPQARRHALNMKLSLMDKPVPDEIREALLAARQALLDRNPGAKVVVRSSALVEDRDGSSFAGQFESYLELACETALLLAFHARPPTRA